MIEVKNLVKKYGNHLAVDHLSFTVEKGQIYGFLGPNGAGKSTTMNIMTGYISATEGEVTINGHSIFDEPEEAKRAIGYLPELPPVYQEMTVREYLKFAAELKGVKKSERENAIEEVMDMAKIKHVENRLIKNLSKGYRQRVGIAQAIIGNPEVIILDEPTVGLDPKQIIEIRDLIKRLSKRHTIILSSHILQEVSAVCDHIMIIAHGKLVASDTPENLTKLMSVSRTLTIDVKGEKAKVEAAVKKVIDGKNIKISKTEEEDVVRVVIATETDADIREEIFYALADAKCAILMMNSTQVSLEDVFLELTSDNNTAAPNKKVAKKSILNKKRAKEELDDIESEDELEEAELEDNGGEE